MLLCFYQCCWTSKVSYIHVRLLGVPVYTAVNFVSGRPGPWSYANSPVEFGHDHIGSQ